MKLQIDNYRISKLDDLNIVIEQYIKLNPRNPFGRHGSQGKAKPTTNKFKWVRLGYYATLADALNKLANHKLLSVDGEQTAQDLLSSLAQLKEEILEKVSEKSGW